MYIVFVLQLGMELIVQGKSWLTGNIIGMIR